jgi:hypothetical protein
MECVKGILGAFIRAVHLHGGIDSVPLNGTIQFNIHTKLAPPLVISQIPLLRALRCHVSI